MLRLSNSVFLLRQSTREQEIITRRHFTLCFWKQLFPRTPHWCLVRHLLLHYNMSGGKQVHLRLGELKRKLDTPIEDPLL